MDAYALVYARVAYIPSLLAALDLPYAIVTNRADLLAQIAKQRPAIAYIDRDLLPHAEGECNGFPVVAIVPGGLDEFITTLHDLPWISHVVSTDALSRTNLSRFHLRLTHGPAHHVLGASSRCSRTRIAARRGSSACASSSRAAAFRRGSCRR
jgi:hypothetical protein